MSDNPSRENMIEHALDHIRQGRYDEGEVLLGRVVDDRETPFELKLTALGHRGYMRMGLGRFREALADYQVICDENPADARALAIKARLLVENGNPQDAITDAVKALSMDGKDVYSAKTIRKAQNALGLVDLSESHKLSGPLPLPEEPRNKVLEILEKDPGSSFPTSIHPEIGRLIYSIVRALKPSIVVETGSYIGYSGICIAQAMEDNKVGHLHCFDLFGEVSDEPVPITNYTSPILGRRKTFLEIASGHFKEAGLDHRVTLHAGDSSSMMREYFKANPTRVQMAFIDGDHTIKGALKDWYAVDELLDNDAMVLLHDTVDEASKWRGPRYLLQELGEDLASKYQWVHFPTFDGIGLGLIQKRKAGIPSPRFRPSLPELLADRIYFHALWCGSKELKQKTIERIENRKR